MDSHLTTLELGDEYEEHRKALLRATLERRAAKKATSH
jgi:hypothetical protein